MSYPHTRMEIKGLKPVFGLKADSDKPLIIAGPCSAETREQTLLTARGLAPLGVKVFRAGVWKPRTKPGGFEGRGEEALQWLREVRETTGMLVATEIANRRHLREALEAGMDGIWIGARTSTNPFAVQEIADALALLPEERKDTLTILVKNPVNPDLDLWIGAIERIYNAGMRRIGAIHRGFSSYGKHLYRNQPRWALAIELARRIPELPVLFDPSHVAGMAELVPRLARQAVDMNYDGLIIESHCNPECALTDAAQQLSPAALGSLLEILEKRVQSPSTESLDDLRRTIDSLDDRLLDLLARRMEVSRRIGDYKRKNKLPVVQMDRYRDLLETRSSEAEKIGLSPDFIRQLLALIHEESVRQQT